MLIYDSHCHAEAINVSDIASHYINNEVAIIPGVDLNSITALVALRNNYIQYKVGFGIHPWYIDANLNHHKQLSRLDTEISQFKPDFIGEIGLDYLKPHHELQKEYFIGQLQLALKYKLPIIMHCVKAYNDVLSILKQYIRVDTIQHSKMGIIHAFNTNAIIAQEFIQLGFLLGIGSLITKTSQISKNIEQIPITSLVLESDAPYMSAFGKEKSSSSDCFLYAQIAAKHLNINLIDLINCSNSNVLNLFRCD